MNDSDKFELTGADALVQTLADLGVDSCFANPGTSEMQLIAALDKESRIRSVLCLFEGVATGAADGYARISGKPAMTLLHLGPGYLNGGANIHNAFRAKSPMINVVGDHAVSHQRYDAPLASDIIGLAASSSRWIKSVDKVEQAGNLATEAWEACHGPEPGPVSLVLPADSAWKEGGRKGAMVRAPELRRPSHEKIETAVQAIKTAKSPMILMNGSALSETGLKHAAKLNTNGIRIMIDTFAPKIARGVGRFMPDRMHYFAEGAMQDLKDCDLMILAGTKAPVAFFAYPDRPSLLVPEGCKVVSLGGFDTDSEKILFELVKAFGIENSAPLANRVCPDKPAGKLSGTTIGTSIARYLPSNAIVSDDGVSNSIGCYFATVNAEPHDWLMLTGGAIGQGMPVALGAALAAPDRKVLCLSGDGAGMYTCQSLWSMARENVDVTTIVFVNHSYRILNIEQSRTGAKDPGHVAKSMLDLSNPEIDWVRLAQSMGVPGTLCTTAEEFDSALERAFSKEGPSLIAALLNE